MWNYFRHTVLILSAYVPNIIFRSHFVFCFYHHPTSKACFIVCIRILMDCRPSTNRIPIFVCRWQMSHTQSFVVSKMNLKPLSRDILESMESYPTTGMSIHIMCLFLSHNLIDTPYIPLGTATSSARVVLCPKIGSMTIKISKLSASPLRYMPYMSLWNNSV